MVLSSWVLLTEGPFFRSLMHFYFEAMHLLVGVGGFIMTSNKKSLNLCDIETWGFPVVKLGSTKLPVMVYKSV